MKLIGLLGGVASGKSMVAEMFRRLGAEVLDADRVGHEVLRMPAVRAAVGGRWGKDVIGPDGEVNRPALAKIVFAPPPDGPRELAELERITHPEIRRRLQAKSAELGSPGAPNGDPGCPGHVKSRLEPVVRCPGVCRCAARPAASPGGQLGAGRRRSWLAVKPPKSRSRRNAASQISCWIIRRM